MDLVPHMVILSDCCCCWWWCGCDIPDWMMRCRDTWELEIWIFYILNGWMDGWPDAILAASVYTFFRVYHKQPTKHLFCIVLFLVFGRLGLLFISELGYFCNHKWNLLFSWYTFLAFGWDYLLDVIVLVSYLLMGRRGSCDVFSFCLLVLSWQLHNL